MLPTLLSILQKTADYFHRKGVESPRLNAELLLSYLLGLSRMQLYLQYDRPIIEPELEKFRVMVNRRAQREPLQYITGTAYFRDLSLVVGPGVLIPRPETEVLVQTAIEQLKSFDFPRVLDYGTGSGCIVLGIAGELENIEIVAAEKSEKAIEFAKQNAGKNNLDKRKIIWVHTEVIDSSLGMFDAVVSNPPYIPSAEIERLQPEVRFEPKEALDGGVDGMDFYRMFAERLPIVLKNKGVLIAEIGRDQAENIKDIFSTTRKWGEPRFFNDFNGTPRVLVIKAK